MMLPKVLALAAIVPIVLAFAAPAHAQVQTEVPPVVPGAKPVTAERIKIHGTALEGNLEGDAVDRDVIVYLPPSYQTDRNRRYPVVYALHGYSVGAEQWSKEIHVPQSIEGAFALGAKEMIAEVKTAADAARLPGTLRSLLAGAAAWSPNPTKPPLYVDLPYQDSVLQEDVLARWAANAPLSFVDQYISNLRQYNGIAIDVGDRDGLRVDAGKLHDALDRYGLAHTFEVYSGTHTSAMGVRFQNNVMPFFSQRLCSTQKCE